MKLLLLSCYHAGDAMAQINPPSPPTTPATPEFPPDQPPEEIHSEPPPMEDPPDKKPPLIDPAIPDVKNEAIDHSGAFTGMGWKFPTVFICLINVRHRTDLSVFKLHDMKTSYMRRKICILPTILLLQPIRLIL